MPTTIVILDAAKNLLTTPMPYGTSPPEEVVRIRALMAEREAHPVISTDPIPASYRHWISKEEISHAASQT